VEHFLAQYGADVTGVVSGYDRLRLGSSLPHLDQPTFMFQYLCAAGVVLKDFAASRRPAAGSGTTAQARSNPLGKDCDRREPVGGSLAP
jgi:hypothetical protein